MKKQCRTCHVSKTLDQFYKTPSGKHGRAAHCKPCMKIIRANDTGLAERARRYRESEKGKANASRHREANKEKMKEYQRSWHLQRRFGITLEQFTAMLKGQKNKCKACRTKTPGGRGTWHIDHCHKTGKVRGILCNNCNVAAGLMQDSAQRALDLAVYLDNVGKFEKIEKVTLSDLRESLSRNRKKKVEK